MSDKLGTTWGIEPHTEAKHEILRYYLGAWFPILASVHRRLLYVDGFAGPGEYSKGEDGSPIIALKVARDHVLKAKLTRPGMELVFLFIEKDEARCQNLEQRLDKMRLPSNFVVPTPICRSFEEVFDEVLCKIEEQNKQLAPCFLFIDPFGPTGFPMTLISRLAQQPRSEVLITFNYQSLNQWFLSDPHKHNYLDTLYGSGIWHQALRILDPRQKESCLMRAYQESLESLGWKVRPFRMVNKHNQTQYYLFFGTHNWRGMLAMKEAMWKAAPEGDFQYSDLTNPEQASLFEEIYKEEYSRELADRLYENHPGQTLSKETLRRNDLAWHPICIGHHLKRALQILECESIPPRIIDVQLPNGRKRRPRQGKNTYPDDCTITFAP